MEFQLADLFECLCDADPDAEVLVAGGLRRSRLELDRRANRLAHYLLDQGIGRGDHVGIYSHNRCEWVEALVACWKLGAAGININYRYVTNELRYLWQNSDIRALVYERGFATQVRALADDFPALRHYLVLDDGSDTAAPALGTGYEEALLTGSPERDFDPRSGDDLYLVYTGGTTGMPKGVVWRHEDLYTNIARPLTGGIDEPEEISKQSGNPLGMRTLTLSPLMHGGGQWPLFITVLNGGVALFPISASLDAHEVLSIIAREGVTTLSIIGDAMGLPIAEARLDPDYAYDTSSLKAISTGGALLTDPVRKRLREAFGRVYITGGIGSSEIGGAAKETRAFDPSTGPRFALDPTVAVLDDALRPIAPGSGGIGRLARCGAIPLGYYKDEAKTAATFAHDAAGVRWSLPGDYARVEEDGTITLLGRGSQCINSGGEKIFPDEVEAVITRHASVRHAVVLGVPDPKWMQRVVVLVELEEGAVPPSLEALQQHCREHLAGYKIPRAMASCRIERLPTGKVDHTWARGYAEQHLAPPKP